MPPMSELRIDIPADEKTKFVVSEGTAEESGAELLLGKWYAAKGAALFLFTYTGCTVKIAPSKSFYYVSEETNIPYILKLFSALLEEKKKVLLIAGPGRTTLSNILSNYYSRQGEKVLRVELDSYKGSLLFPGTFSCAITNGISSNLDPGETQERLCFFYGKESPSDNPDLYSLLQKKLLSAVQKKGFPGPIIITAHRETTKDEVDKIADILPVDQVLVVGNERLLQEISNSDKIHIPCFPGIIREEAERRRADINTGIKKYFYGESEEYTPSTITLQVSNEETEEEHCVVEIGDEYMAPMSALPLGSSRRKNSTAARICTAVEGALLGISSAGTLEEVPGAAVIGFLLVLKVLSDKEIKVLCPQGKCPNRKYLVQGKIRLLE